MSDKQLRISRRKVLAGLGAVGLASAGAGLGTSAYFNDVEEFNGNVLEAGKLDLLVHWYTYVDQGIAGELEREGTVNGPDSYVSAELTDMKPGDNGKLRFCFDIDDNPAYLWTCGVITSDMENGQPEPELNHPGGDDDGEDGELDEKIMATLQYCYEEGDGYVDGDVIADGTLADVMDALEMGVPLSGDGEVPETAAGAEPFDGLREEAVDNPCLCLNWEIPTSVGNEIQTDSLTFDMAFHAIQARHNEENAVNPCSMVEEVCGDGWGKLEIEDFGDASEMQAKVRLPTSGHEMFAGRGTAYGAAGVSSGEAPVPNDADDFRAFELHYDGADTLTFEYNGVTQTYDKGDLGTPQDKIEITARADAEGAMTKVRNAKLVTDSVTKEFGPIEADSETGKRYCGLTGVPDLADGFTLTGELAMAYPDISSELVAMYLHVDTTA